MPWNSSAIVNVTSAWSVSSSLISADSDHLVVEECHEGEMVHIVDVHELA